MHKTDLKNIRNIGIFSDSDKQKINFTDRITSYTPLEERMRDGQALDWMEGGCGRHEDMLYTLQAVTTSWLGQQINIVDVPTFLDFENKFERSMQVIDGGISLFSAVEGVQPNAIMLSKERVKHLIPSIAFIGQVERGGADFFGVVEQISDRLKINPLIIQLPIYSDEKFEGIIDLIAMRELDWQKEQDFYYSRDDVKESLIRQEFRNQAKSYQTKMLEQLAVVDGNEKLLAKFLEDEEITQEEIVEAIRVATLSMAVVPILLGCASKNRGIQMLVDAVVAYLPSPLDAPAIQVDAVGYENRKLMVKSSNSGTFVGLVYNIIIDPFLGELAIVRVYSGSLKSGSAFYNVNREKRDRVYRIVKMHETRREEVDELFAGEIGFLLGLKSIAKGDTLCDLAKKVRIETLKKSPEPTLFVTVQPRVKWSPTDIMRCFMQLVIDSPSCKAVYGKYPAEPILLYGQSKAHIETLLDKLKNKFGIEAWVSEPKIAYLETIKKVVKKEYTYRQPPTSHSRTQFAHLCLKVEPEEQGSGYSFIDATKGEIIPKEFIEPINQGIQERLSQGIQAGFPIVDIKVTLYDGSFNDVDSSVEAFKIAGGDGFIMACREASPILLEPIMKVNIEAPEQYKGAVFADITKRRGIACGRESQGERVGDVFIPLAEVLNYERKLSKLTDGLAIYTMQFERYEELPDYLVDSLI
ncbi:elongation factor G [Sulfurovum sp. bin170]|uniref:elongation factor G n=1 Tax=Sulfurovum sp. bin170 TaxID=2695268 RepID=UPI0013E06666|nr:GTP-binding protein [Sulfurovum sp. bin170]NEW59815.1 elongation factor G [Sulfurovum sp. bin170]